MLWLQGLEIPVFTVSGRNIRLKGQKATNNPLEDMYG